MIHEFYPSIKMFSLLKQLNSVWHHYGSFCFLRWLKFQSGFIMKHLILETMFKFSLMGIVLVFLQQKSSFILAQRSLSLWISVILIWWAGNFLFFETIKTCIESHREIIIIETVKSWTSQVVGIKSQGPESEKISKEI